MSRTLKLHINQSGSWRRALDFAPAEEDAVRAAAVALVRCVGGHTTKLRITDTDGHACAYANPPDWCWRPA